VSARRQFRGTGVITAIAAVMIAPDLIQDQAAPPQVSGQSLVFSPWTKFCLKSKEPNGKEVCFTGQDGRVEVVPRAYDAPSTDPEVFRAQQEKLQAELQRRAEEARKKLEEVRKKRENDQTK
jgi:hypothetical protein